MRHSRCGAQLLELAIAAFLGSACLPTGSPPLGQQLISDRTLTGAFFAPSGGEGVASTLLASGPLRAVGLENVPGFDLYQFPYSSVAGPQNGLAGLSPTVDSLMLDEGGGSPAAYVPRTDSSGRLIYVKAAASADMLPSYVARFDFSTGQEDYLGLPVRKPLGFLLSSSRSRVLVNDLIFEPDGTISPIGPLGPSEPVFIEDNLFYATTVSGEIGMAGRINRSRPDGAIESLMSSTSLVTFRPIPSDEATQLLVSWKTEAGEVPYLLFDTQRLVSTLLPTQRGSAEFWVASSDGHWLLFRSVESESTTRLFLFDRTTNDNASLPVLGPATEAEWRPGHAQLWVPLPNDLNIVWSSVEESSPGAFTAATTKATFSPDGRQSMFTRDGRHWLSVDARTVGDALEIAWLVGDADKPSLPRVQLNPWGEALAALWETSDGRLLVGASPVHEDSRQDLYFVDPSTGSSRLIASGGHLVALGQTRALALLNWQLSSSTGDLTLVDLETGDKTVLAESVYDVALDPGSGTAAEADALASGRQLAFLIRNRLASPYDGLWVARLP